jgi:hypothetical protein
VTVVDVPLPSSEVLNLTYRTADGQVAERLVKQRQEELVEHLRLDLSILTRDRIEGSASGSPGPTVNDD